MNVTLEKITIESKTNELCSAIVEDASFVKLQAQIDAFLSNDEARLQYQSVQECGESLNQKQRAGVELSEVEISEFEQAREELLKNSLVTDFMSAQSDLQEIQKTIGKMIGLTLELGRVPNQQDIETASGGCCGGGGCGC